MFIRLLHTLFLAACVGLVAVAQNVSPAYALAFRANDMIYMAEFREEGGWAVETLPNLLLFGQYDVSLVLPKWTNNGQLMGIGYDPGRSFASEALYEEDATYLYRYELQTQVMEAMPEAIETDTSDIPLILAISALSPDGRYATLYNIMNPEGGYLVDFANQELLFKLDSCGLKAFYWTETTVFLGSYSAYISCPPTFLEFDLSNREILQDYSAGLAGHDITVFDTGIRLSDSEFLLAAYGMETYYKLVYLSDASSRIITPLDPVPFAVSENQAMAAFSADNRVKLLELTSLEFVDVADTEAWLTPFFVGQTLHYGETVSSENTVQYRHGSVSWDSEAALDILYEGIAEQHRFSPTLDFVAVVGTGGIEVHGEAGLLWESSALEFNLSQVSLRWSEDGNWLYIQQDAGTISVNPVTGVVVQAPEEYARFISTSPDGQWWLYMVRQPGDESAMYQSERLFLYNPQTQESFVLVDGENIYDNFHFPLESYFLWSPILD